MQWGAWSGRGVLGRPKEVGRVRVEACTCSVLAWCRYEGQGQERGECGSANQSQIERAKQDAPAGHSRQQSCSKAHAMQGERRKGCRR